MIKSTTPELNRPGRNRRTFIGATVGTATALLSGQAKGEAFASTTPASPADASLGCKFPPNFWWGAATPRVLRVR